MHNTQLKACCLLLVLLSQTVRAQEIQRPNYDSEDRTSNVEIFSDQLLPQSQHIGHKMFGLGRIELLDTTLGPRSPHTMSTAFSVFSGWRNMRSIKFRVPIPESESERYKYHFDLNLIREANFNPKWRTVVMTPGYLSGQEDEWVKNATREWLDLFEGQINVIQVSWADSNKGHYSQAVANTKLVARQIVIFFHYLAELSGFKLFDNHDEAANTFLDNLHLVGHSLGAHISGFVGQDLGGRVGRITGLDAAGPYFNHFTRLDRLDRRQAKLVEVLHTNRGHIKYMKLAASALFGIWRKALGCATPKGGLFSSSAAFGIDHRLGHIDLYANDGHLQPGCRHSFLHHSRATEIYVDVLRRHTALKKLVKSGNPSTRLLAFKAPTYDSFQWGSNLFAECPSVLDLKTHLNQTEISQALSKCAIPLLDFTTPTLQLVREYKDRFGIDFEPIALPEEQPYFHFATTTGLFVLNGYPDQSTNVFHQNRLVGDHYLVKIYLSEKPKWPEIPNSDGVMKSICLLRIQLTMKDVDPISMELDELPPDFLNGKLILAVPFIHPDGSNAAKRLSQLLDHLEAENSNSLQFRSLFRKHFPEQIKISMPKSGKVWGPSKSCSLSIKNIEVQPLFLDSRPTREYKNLAALYGYPGPEAELKLPVLTVSRLEKQPNNILKLKTISKKKTDSCDVQPVAALIAD